MLQFLFLLLLFLQDFIARLYFKRFVIKKNFVHQIMASKNKFNFNILVGKKIKTIVIQTTFDEVIKSSLFEGGLKSLWPEVGHFHYLTCYIRSPGNMTYVSALLRLLLSFKRSFIFFFKFYFFAPSCQCLLYCVAHFLLLLSEYTTNTDENQE